jgi:hypothetical protein
VVVGNHFENRNADMNKRTWLVSAGLTLAMAGLLGTGAAVAATPPGGGARSGPADGGATGIVETVSTSSIILTTATGVEVVADEDSATKYQVGSLPATVHAVWAGESVLVLGLVDNATVTATAIVVQPGGDGGVREAAKAGVIPFQQGVSSPVKSVGQIPPDYTEGDGTIVGGTVADRATAAAQAVVPGGIVDRVVRLSDGDYEVHNISVNWPHHVFLSPEFTVLGYE